MACVSRGLTPIPCVDETHYRRQMHRFHPDRNPGCREEARRKFILLSTRRNCPEGHNMFSNYGIPPNTNYVNANGTIETSPAENGEIPIPVGPPPQNPVMPLGIGNVEEIDGGKRRNRKRTKRRKSRRSH